MYERFALFGPAGNSLSFSESHKSTIEAPQWLYDLGLDAYEYQCGNGVRISTATAETIGDLARKNNIDMSLHSPYYISVTNLENLEKNIEYIMQSCAVAKSMGARRVVVHSGSTTGREREDALKDAIFTFGRLIEEMDKNGYGDIILCPETMGKINQLGTLDEVLEICAVHERLLPCIDFAHLYARTLGEINGYERTAALFDAMENRLGAARAKNFHAHFSKIEYTKGGEKKHLSFDNDEFGPEFRPVARLVAERKYAPTFICESAGTQAEDAMDMKHIYYEELQRSL